MTAGLGGVTLREAHSAQGAAFAPAGGLELPAWYGTGEAAAVAAEYAAAREGAAVVDLAERGRLAVTGPLRQKFLHNVVSNDVQGRAPGQGCLASLMDVKGHLLALFRVLVTPDAVLLEMPAERLAPVEATLQHYRVAAPVRFAVEPVSVLGLLGPRAGDALARAGCERHLGGIGSGRGPGRGDGPRDPSEPPMSAGDLGAEEHVGVRLAGHEVLLARASDLPCGGFVLHVAPAGAGALWRALQEAGARALGRRALDALRVEQGLPWYGPDVSEENLLHETGLVPLYHSPAKGCYVGQEVIARLEARGGHVNKALRGLRLGAPSAADAPVLLGDQEIGRVTTAAVSPRLGPVAMGYVHRNHFAPGTAVTVGGRPATVTSLPLEG